MAEKLQGLLLDLDQGMQENCSVVELYIKTRQGIKTVVDSQFTPYLYASVNDFAEAENLPSKPLPSGIKVKAVEKAEKARAGPSADWAGQTLAKVYFENTKDLAAARAELKKLDFVLELFEFDIPFTKRYTIDKSLRPLGLVEAAVEEKEGTLVLQSIKNLADEKLEQELSKLGGKTGLRIAAFDLETFSPGRFSEAKTDPIIMASYADQGEQIVFTWKKELGYIPFVEVLASEKEMIQALAEKIKSRQPDILVTYNGDGFDFPYILERAKQLKVKLDFGQGKAPEMKKVGLGFAAKTKAMLHVDAFQLIRLLSRLAVIDLVKFDLESVYESLFGEKKEKLHAEMINEIWQNGGSEDLLKLAEYNRDDSIAALKITERFYPLLAELSKLVKQSPWDVGRTTASNLVEYLLLGKAFELNMLAPNRPSEEATKQRVMQSSFEGGFVKEPLPGLHERIAVLDFRSLHPSIIISHNISPETLDCKHNSCAKGKNLAPTSHWFCAKEGGFLAGVLKEILGKRIEAKKELKKAKKGSAEWQSLQAKQHALKILLNSVHPDEPVVLKLGNKIFIENIGPFIDKHMKKPEKILSTDLCDPPKDLEVLSFSDDKVLFKPVKKLIRHKAAHEMYCVKLNSGREIKLTKDHGLFTLKNNRLQEIETSKLRPDTPIIVPCNVPNIENELVTINFIELLFGLPEKETDKLVVSIESKYLKRKRELKTRCLILKMLSNRDGAFISEIARDIKIKSRAVSKNLKNLQLEGYVKAEQTMQDKKQPQKKFFSITEKGSKRLKVEKIFLNEFTYAAWEYVAPLNSLRAVINELRSEDLERLKVGRRRGIKINVLCKHPKEFMRFLGYYVSEGYSRIQMHGKGHSTSIQIANYDKDLLRDIKSCIKKAFNQHPKEASDRIGINSKVIYLILKCLNSGKTAGEKRIPSFIFTAPKNLKIEFLHAYYLGDGNKNFPRMTSKNKSLINDLVFLVKSIGCKDIRLTYDCGVYRLEVRDGLPFLPRKRTVKGTYPYTLPKEFVIDLLKNVGMLRDLNQNKRKTAPIPLIKKALKKYEQARGITPETTLIKNLIKSELRFDRVKEVEKIGANIKFVYDFSVEGTERFVAGHGLLGVHNSHYGYLAYARSRWYSRECARAVTAWSRHYVKEVNEKAEQAGFTSLYADSVTADRFVPILDQNGFIEVKNIEELFEENKNKSFERRDKEIIALNRFKTLSLNPKTLKPEWKPIREIIRHKTNKKVFRVNQKFGEVKVTEDHSIIVLENGQLKEVKPIEMQEKKFIKLEEIPSGNEIKVIDLFEKLKAYHHEQFYKDRIKISQIHKDDQFVWFGWTNQKKQIKVKKIIKAESPEFGALCRLLGAYIAEGGSSTVETTKSKKGASLSSSDIGWLKELQKDYHTLFENAVTCVIPSQQKEQVLDYAGSAGQKTVQYLDQTHKLQMMNETSAVFFKMLCGQKSSGKKLPNFIFNAPKKYKLMLLQKLIEGNGSKKFCERYSEDYVAKNFRLETKSLPLASGLSLLLTQLNKKHIIRYRKDKQTYTLQTNTDFNSRVTTKIEEEKTTSFVYDLNVEKNNNFVDACGQVLLHNTDSAFLLLPEGKKEKEVLRFVDGINQDLPETMELEFEGLFKRGIFVTKKSGEKAAKKKYALIDYDNNLKIVGFEYVRRDWAPIARNTQRKVIELVLGEGQSEKAVEFVRKIIKELKSGKVKKKDLVILTQIKKPLRSYEALTPHTAAAAKALEKGKSLGVGSVVGYVITSHGGKQISERAELEEFVQEGDYDADYYISNQVVPAVIKIMNELGFSEEDLIQGGKQSNLSSFV